MNQYNHFFLAFKVYDLLCKVVAAIKVWSNDGLGLFIFEDGVACGGTDAPGCCKQNEGD